MLTNALCQRICIQPGISKAQSLLLAHARPAAAQLLSSEALNMKMEASKPKRKKEVRISQNSTSYVQVLGNGTDTGDACPSILLFFEHTRFVFNVGEGFQRYCCESKIKLGKVKDYFLTRMMSDAYGGLPGLILTLTDYGVGGPCSGTGKIRLHGPQNTYVLLDAIQTFVALRDEVLISNFGARSTNRKGEFLEPVVSDPNVVISPMVLLPEMKMQESAPDEDLEDDGSCESSRKKPRMDPLGAKDVHPGAPAACYLCQLSEGKGRFHPEKAMALGINPGPSYSKLQEGGSVPNKEGRMVHAHEVMDAAVPGPVLLIVDCPDFHYVQPLIQSSGFKPWLDRPREKDESVVVIHLGPAAVVSSQSYSDWVCRFPKGADHIFVNLEACQSSAVLRKAAVVQTKLNCIDEHIFPIPSVASVCHPEANSSQWTKDGCIPGKDMLKYCLKPISKKGPDDREVLLPFSEAEARKTLGQDCADALSAIRKYKNEICNLQPSENNVPSLPSDELELTFLGTGSAVPSKYRNVTGIYFDFFKKGSMLVDCGEGSYGQLVRRFGINGAKDAICKLKCIWISHIHADHHAGLPRLLSAREKFMGDAVDPILIIGPPALRKTLMKFAQIDSISYNYLISNSVATMDHNGEELVWNKSKVGAKRSQSLPKNSMDSLQAVKQALQLTALDSFFVKHCSNAFGLKLEADNWKVVFSGDSMVCESIAKAAKDATLLIHEATFEEEMVQEAIHKKHSTTKDAIETATKSGAYRTILTHFSQRYPKIPVLSNSASGERSRIAIAFDLMSINLADLERLPLTVEPCMYIFDEEAPEADVEDDLMKGE